LIEFLSRGVVANFYIAKIFFWILNIGFWSIKRYFGVTAWMMWGVALKKSE
jgi:hypothetical protein